MLFLVFGLVFCGAIGLILYARWNYGVLESLNIPVVKRSFLLGSTPDLHLKVQHLEDIERFNKYGSIYGVYEGRKPQVHVCDPELIRLIFVKDYDHFSNRRDIDLGDPVMNELTDFLPGEKWRVVRSAQTPVFTTGKLKLMSVGMKDSSVEFCKAMELECNNNNGAVKVDIRSQFDGFLIDLFCRCAFGIKLDNDNTSDSRNVFIKLFKDLMGQDQDFNYLYMLSMVFPFLIKFAPTLNSDPVIKISGILRGIIKERKDSGQKHNDFVDLLNDMMAKLATAEYKNLGITENTILAQGIGFVLAGYDAMTTTMTMLTYYLSQYPDIQDRLLEEIDGYIQKYDGSIPFENLNELVYLQACLSETLRLCPPFIRPERICTKDWEHNGVKITKGLVVMAPAWAVSRNTEYFSDPDKFDPERFLPENKANMNPYAFTTFGHGPRNCIGTRFAYEALKLGLCYFLKQFRVQKTPETKITWKTGVLFLIMHDPIYLNVVKRNIE